MPGLREVLADTLREPEMVVESASDAEARLYYRFYRRTMVGGKHLCVVVKTRRDDAFVVTAYLTDRVKRGIIVWQRES